jgi:hypothetical protein
MRSQGGGAVLTGVMIRQGRFFQSIKLLTKPLDDCPQIIDLVLEHLPKLFVMRRLVCFWCWRGFSSVIPDC